MTMPNFCINFLNKAAKSLPILYDFAVASLVDAWIKMLLIQYFARMVKSHPSWMRGLKSIVSLFRIVRFVSHPSWMRGLKSLKNIQKEAVICVASLVDAWIKIGRRSPGSCPLCKSHPSRCVD